MIIVRGQMRWDSDFPTPLSDLARLAGEVRSRHEGNITYRFSVDAGSPSTLYLDEARTALEFFHKHGQTPEVAQIRKVLAPGAKEIALEIHDVASTTQVPVNLGA